MVAKLPRTVKNVAIIGNDAVVPYARMAPGRQLAPPRRSYSRLDYQMTYQAPNTYTIANILVNNGAPVNVDQAALPIAVTLNATQPFSGVCCDGAQWPGVHSPTFTVTLAGSDDLSGVGEYLVQYRIGNGAWTDC